MPSSPLKDAARLVREADEVREAARQSAQGSADGDSVEMYVSTALDSDEHAPDLNGKRVVVVMSAMDANLSLKEVERRHIARVLANSPTLQTAAARLGIDASTLWRKRRQYGIEVL